MSRRAEEHASRYEVGSNVGCPKHLSTSSTGMVSGGDIVEAQLSHLVPIGEWCWLLGEGTRMCVDQHRGYPQLSGPVYRTHSHPVETRYVLTSFQGFGSAWKKPPRL